MILSNFIFKEKKYIYKLINEAAPIIQGHKNNLFLHDKNRYGIKHQTSEQTFVGKMSCGVCCFLLNYYLDNLGIETKIMKSTFGYGKYLEDHCFLLHNDIIIDPTYRQMFLGIDPYDKYSQHLFEEVPFIFVGKYSNLEKYYYNLSNIHKKIYNTKNSNYENLIFWKNPKTFNTDINLKKIKQCKKYSLEKGENYLNLHNSSMHRAYDNFGRNLCFAFFFARLKIWNLLYD